MEKNSVSYSCATFIGKRKTNQDNFIADGEAPFVSRKMNLDGGGVCAEQPASIFAVFDGIGGLGDSAEIARAAAELLCERFRDVTEETDAALWIKETLDEADALARQVSARCGTSGGTTATVVILRGNECVLVNVGDSPAFVLQSDGKLHELTIRHNMESYKKMAGVTPSPGDERILLYGVGAGEAQPSRAAHIARGTLNDGDILLLCTDGVTNAFTEDELAGAILRGVEAKQIVFSAGQIDHADNATAVIIHFRTDE
ncbi:MAG: protein serine/threonine phosphatase 2C family protein [Clostridia bacterium]|nr:protein serine/threonine phosphatase 2C family protein [Clostridia bacterium]